MLPAPGPDPAPAPRSAHVVPAGRPGCETQLAACETRLCFSIARDGAGGGEPRKPLQGPREAALRGAEQRTAVPRAATGLSCVRRKMSSLPLRPARAFGPAADTCRGERLGNTSLVTELPRHRLGTPHLPTDLPRPTRFTAPRSRALSCSLCNRNRLMNTLKNGKPTVSF